MRSQLYNAPQGAYGVSHLDAEEAYGPSPSRYYVSVIPIRRLEMDQQPQSLQAEREVERCENREAPQQKRRQWGFGIFCCSGHEYGVYGLTIVAVVGRRF